MENDCIFCKIVNGVVPSAKVYDDKNFFAFLDINPVSYGHTLLIPKKHYINLLESDDSTVKEIFVTAKKLMKRIKDSLKCDYVALSVVGVDVPHFHIHLIPRKYNDGLANFWPTKKYQSGEIDKYKETLIGNNKS